MFWITYYRDNQSIHWLWSSPVSRLEIAFRGLAKVGTVRRRTINSNHRIGKSRKLVRNAYMDVLSFPMERWNSLDSGTGSSCLWIVERPRDELVIHSIPSQHVPGFRIQSNPESFQLFLNKTTLEAKCFT